MGRAKRYLLEFLATLGLFVVVAGMLGWFVITQPFVAPAVQSRDRAAVPARLQRYVEHLSQTLPPRDDDPQNLLASAKYLHDEFSRFGAPAYQAFDVQGITYKNVVLTIEGESPDTIVVGAHYDAFNGYPGADDNASGVAGILELARMFAANRPPVTVTLVAFALEEPPYFNTSHMGSNHHAELMVSAGKNPVLMISLEMIGYYSDEPQSQRYPIPALSHLYSDMANFIAIVGRISEISAVRTVKSAFLANSQLPVYSLNFLPIIPAMWFSDHKNYWDRGIRGIMITDTAFERNDNYHTKNDTADTLDYERMAQVVNSTYDAIVLLGKTLK